MSDTTTPLTLKDIHDAIRDVKLSGGHVSDLEAFLVHTDDLKALMASEPALQTGMAGDEELKIYGVKIIDSHYTMKGAIFKIFKNGPPLHPLTFHGPTVPVSGTIDMSPNPFVGIGVSGIIPNWDKQISMPPILSSGNISVEPEPEKPKKPKKERNTNRRIELD